MRPVRPYRQSKPLTGPAPPRRSVCAPGRADPIVEQTTSAKETLMWARSLAAYLKPRPRRPIRRALRQHQAPRLRLEALEDRTVPSTLTVTSAADDGSAGTLRAAIAGSSSGDTVNFDPGLAGQTITLTGGELAITQSLTIVGLGADQLTVSGNDASRVFDVSGSGTSVEIDDLTIAHGLANNSGGGGILNAGSTLTLAHDAFADNQAVGAPGSGAKGGGVFNQGG